MLHTLLWELTVLDKPSLSFMVQALPNPVHSWSWETSFGSGGRMVKIGQFEKRVEVWVGC
jgi:hypothetical protein